MKKKINLFIVLSIAAFCMCGCQGNQRPLCRVVTQVDIACDHEGIPIRRHYTDTEKMEAVLLHLRLLRPSGAPAIDPEALDADVYEITVSLSDGQQRIYQQKDHRYFRKGTSGWQCIAPERASRLYTLLRQYQSDV